MFTVPVGDWFRTTKSGHCEQRIAQLAVATPLLSEAPMRSLLDEHRSVRRNNTSELRALISRSHWIDQP
jgi:asparagine synthase (glutamine-hydrolysing)